MWKEIEWPFGDLSLKKGKLFVDENIAKAAETLKDVLGFAAKSVMDAGLGERSDEDVCALAWREKRIILTCDRDFLDNYRFPFNRCPGVIIVPNPGENFNVFADAVGSALAREGWYSLAYRRKVLVDSDGVWTIREQSTPNRRLRPDGVVLEWSEVEANRNGKVKTAS
jgi:hypothetical protein